MGKQIKTALVGFCWGCQMAHIREHVYYDKETKQTCCKRTGATIEKTGSFYPPIPVVADEEEVFDPTYYGGDDTKIEQQSEAPSIIEMIPAMLEEVVSAVGGDTEIHKDKITQMALTIASWIGEDWRKKRAQSEKVIQMHLIGEIDGNTQKRAEHLAQHLQ